MSQLGQLGLDSVAMRRIPEGLWPREVFPLGHRWSRHVAQSSAHLRLSAAFRAHLLHADSHLGQIILILLAVFPALFGRWC